ncbi:MAG: TonB family protein [Acidobacteriota bacterium]
MIVSKKAKKRTKRWLTFLFSILIHVAVFLPAIVIPLLMTENLPKFSITTAFLAPIPPPPPPPPKKMREVPQEKIAETKPAEPGKLIAPMEIPETIAEEDLSKIGVEGEVEMGVFGGVIGGILGETIKGAVGENIEAPVRAIGDIQPPKLIKRVEPEYPSLALKARVEGVVILEAMTDIYGRVQTVKVLRSIPLLDQAAIDAVRQWQYEPMIINGIPRPVIFIVTVVFELKK